MTKHDSPDNSRQRFFEAALDVWAEKGFHAARMDDIAARAGRSKGSLYHHFASKQELLVGFVSQLFGEVEADLSAGFASAGSASALLRAVIDQFSAQFEADPRMMPVFIELMSISTREEDVRDLLSGYYRQMIDSFERIFAWGVETGEFRADIDTVTVARVFAFAGDGAAMVEAVMAEDGGDLRATLGFLTDMVLRAVASTATPESVPG